MQKVREVTHSHMQKASHSIKGNIYKQTDTLSNFLVAMELATREWALTERIQMKWLSLTSASSEKPTLDPQCPVSKLICSQSQVLGENENFYKPWDYFKLSSFILQNPPVAWPVILVCLCFQE